MFRNAFWGQTGHGVGPVKRENKSCQHQEKKPGIDEPDVAVSIAETKSGIEVPHPIESTI